MPREVRVRAIVPWSRPAVRHPSLRSSAGGAKKRQQQDIAAAKELWQDYKARSKAAKKGK